MRTSSHPLEQQHAQVLAMLIAGALALATSLTAAPASADDGWNVNVDLAMVHQNVYLGSDEHFLMGLPAVEVSRVDGDTTWFLSLPWRGLGVSHLDRQRGLTTGLSANFGGERGPDQYSLGGIPVDHSRQTQIFLAGSPTVTTPVVVEATLEYQTRFGLLKAGLGYHPTTVERDGAEGGTTTHQGFLAAVSVVRPLHVSERLVVFGIAGVELMDPAYADAWFSVDRATSSLAAFDADAGLRDAQVALHASYQASEHVTLSAYCQGLFLTGDAASSPYTRDSKQQTVMLRTSYAF